MLQTQDSRREFRFSSTTKRPFYPNEPLLDTFLIHYDPIYRDRVIASRELVLDAINAMPAYSLKPEVLGLPDAERHLTSRLNLCQM